MDSQDDTKPAPEPWRNDWPRGWMIAGYAALLLAPSAILAPQLLRGAIPHYMDTTMYFFPLRMHAAELLARGEWPWWNRTLLCGMPLFSNPQAALAYPLNWITLAFPSGAGFLLPMTLGLGFFAAMTAMAARRVAGAPPVVAFFAGAAVLAGNYGWTRLQYGNFMNVLAWWPVWLMAAHAYAASASPRAMALAGFAAAMMLLSGAHQLAIFGAIGLGAHALAMMAADPPKARRWLALCAGSAAIGLLVGAPGWLPQWAFMSETARGEGIAREKILAGAFGSITEIGQALLGSMGKGGVDAEAAGSVGYLVFFVAIQFPLASRAIRLWAGCWVVGFTGIVFSYRPLVDGILSVWPSASLFHDPRRFMGISQWAVALAAAVVLTSFNRGREREHPGLTLVRVLLTIAAFWFTRFWEAESAWMYMVCVPVLILLAASWAQTRGSRLEPTLFAAALAGGVLQLAVDTKQSVELSFIESEKLLGRDADEKPLLVEAGVAQGTRVFTIDWQPATSYDFRRPDLEDWALPNLAGLWGMQDAGGYEPARSARQDAWHRANSHWPGGVQPWANYFSLYYPDLNDPTGDPWARAPGSAAILPRWGVPIYIHPAGPGKWAGAAPPADLSGELRVVYLPGEAKGTSARSIGITFNSGLVLKRDLGATTETAAATAAIFFDPAKSERVKLLDRESDRDLLGRLCLARVDLASLIPGASAGGARLAGIELKLAEGDTPLGVFIWNAALERGLEPHAARGLAMAAGLGEPKVLAAWAERANEGSGAARSSADIHIVSANRMTIDAKNATGRPAALEIRIPNWRGWRAEVNGKAAHIAVASEAGGYPWIQIPAVPSGEAKITVSYSPPHLGSSLALCALGLALIAGLVLRRGEEEIHHGATEDTEKSGD